MLERVKSEVCEACDILPWSEDAKDATSFLRVFGTIGEKWFLGEVRRHAIAVLA
jgi:hypothetical protein